MFLALLLLGVLVLLPPFLPQKWAFLGHSIFVFLAGLALLDEHVTPATQDRDRLGIGLLLLWIWLVAGLLGFVITSVRTAWRKTLSERDILPSLVPLAALTAVLLVHWLSNRLAGTERPTLSHLLVAGLPILIIGVLLTYWRKSGVRVAYLVFGLAVSLTVTGLTLKAAGEAFQRLGEAQVKAAGQPFCVLTYAGRDHTRPARSVFELSSLVSRAGGRSFIDDKRRWFFVAGDQYREWLSADGSECPLKVNGNI